MLRENERKRLIREELDRQIEAKKQRCENEQEENRQFNEMHAEHGKLLEQREVEKMRATKAKIMNDKEGRDQ